jgi:hypothetical protein
MRGEVNVAKFAATIFDLLQVMTQRGIRYRTRAKQIFECLLSLYESLTLYNCLAAHVFKDRLDGGYLLPGQPDLIAHLQQMCRPRDAIQFGYFCQTPPTSTAKLSDVLIRKALDSTPLLANIGGRMSVATRWHILLRVNAGGHY